MVGPIKVNGILLSHTNSCSYLFIASFLIVTSKIKLLVFLFIGGGGLFLLKNIKKDKVKFI